MKSCHIYAVISHPDNNRVLVDKNSKELLHTVVQEGEEEYVALERLFHEYNLRCRPFTKPTEHFVRMTIAPDSTISNVVDSVLCSFAQDSDTDVLAFGVDWTYISGLPSSSIKFKGPEDEWYKTDWREKNRITSDVDTKILSSIKHVPVKDSVELLASVKKNIKHLERLLEDVSDHWTYEDMIYRFYHTSFKVYAIQNSTKQMVHWLSRIAGHAPLNKQFMDIVSEGTGKSFDISHNKEWAKHTRPMVEAFFHAKYFLEMAIKYGKALDEDVRVLPSGYASLLYLYNMR